jgi:hypothetical protein
MSNITSGRGKCGEEATYTCAGFSQQGHYHYHRTSSACFMHEHVPSTPQTADLSADTSAPANIDRGSSVNQRGVSWSMPTHTAATDLWHGDNGNLRRSTRTAHRHGRQVDSPPFVTAVDGLIVNVSNQSSSSPLL